MDWIKITGSYYYCPIAHLSYSFLLYSFLILSFYWEVLLISFVQHTNYMPLLH